MRCIFVLRILISGLVAFSVISAQETSTIWRGSKSELVQQRNSIKDERIYGGEDVSRGQFPYMTAIILDGAGLCGGSLISSTTVLTAARCVMGFEDVMVHLGAHNLTDESEEGRLIVKATKLISHEDFDANTLDNDLGLIKLSFSVEASNIYPVALPSRSFAEGNTFENYTARMLGWGLTKKSTEFSDILQSAESIVISNEECKRLYPSVPYVTEYKICLDNIGESGGCLGDSGGPAVLEDSESGKTTQIGIISFASGKCGHNLPLVMTRISMYFDWLSENAGISIDP